MNIIQTDLGLTAQSLTTAQQNLETLNTRIESVHKNLEKQISQDRETLSNKVLELSVQTGHLKDKVKDTENIINPFPKKLFSIDVRIEELARYFGLKFTKAGIYSMKIVYLIEAKMC